MVSGLPDGAFHQRLVNMPFGLAVQTWGDPREAQVQLVFEMRTTTVAKRKANP